MQVHMDANAYGCTAMQGVRLDAGSYKVLTAADSYLSDSMSETSLLMSPEIPNYL